MVSTIGLGTAALSGAYGRIELAHAYELIRRALDAGVTLIDTADFYDGGRVEQVIGRAVADRRDEVVLATRSVRPGVPGDLAKSVERSLVRLGVEHVDLYYLSCLDPDASVAADVASLAGLVQQGKIGHIGLSGATLSQLREATAIHPITAVGAEFSLLGLRAEPELVTETERMGVGLVAARPLGRGFLTGRIKSPDQLWVGDWRHEDPWFRPEGLRAALEPLREVEAVASRLDLGAGRLAIGWLLAQGEHVVPVPSSRDQVHLEMNLAATRVRIGPQALERLNGIFATVFPPVATQSRSLLL